MCVKKKFIFGMLLYNFCQKVEKIMPKRYFNESSCKIKNFLTWECHLPNLDMLLILKNLLQF